MAKQILFNEDARKAIKQGIDKLAAAVRMTLGPRGRAVVIEKGYGAPQVTFDGVTVAKEIELEDKYENLGAEFIKQAADKTNDNVGDGTTTSVVLAHAMIEEGERAIRDKGFNVIQLSEELKRGSGAIIKALESQKEEINDPKKIKEVASLSAKDEVIGRVIADVMEKMGKEGVVTVEDSNSLGITSAMANGMQFDRGYISQYMVTNPEKMEAVLENPAIFVTDKKITSVQEILPILEGLLKHNKKELVIISEDLEGEALATLVLNKLKGVINVLAVKAPGFGDRRKEMLQDIAIITGADFVSEEVGKVVKENSAIGFDIGQKNEPNIIILGNAAKVISDKDKTTIVNGSGPVEKVKERIAQLKNQIKTTEMDFDREKLQERIGKLSGGVAILRVGAPTETAQKELKQRVEDAVAATRAAMEEGIVPGGGIALFNVLSVNAEDFAEHSTEVISAAKNILMHAVEAPVRAIIQNSGENTDSILRKLKERQNSWIGFNAQSNKIENLKEVGIIDPLKVVKMAFTNAISVASTYLTIGAAVTEIPKKDPSAGSGGGMPGMGGMDY